MPWPRSGDFPSRELLSRVCNEVPRPKGEENSHLRITAPRLRLFICADVRLDLCSMRSNICPRIGEILGSERWICLEQIALAGRQTSSVLEHPYRNSRTHNARLAAADVRMGFDPGNESPRSCTTQRSNSALSARLRVS